MPIFETIETTKYKEIVVITGTQQSKTDGLCLNLVGYWLDCKSVPIIYVMPTQDKVEELSKDRFTKMIKSTESLWKKLDKKQNNIAEKYFAGTGIFFAWASSASQLCSTPAGLVILDERDRMNDNVGDEGDPVDLAEARTTTYPNAKVVVVSTPTIAGASAIFKRYENGTQSKWCLPCPKCGEYFFPSRVLLQWVEKDGCLENAYLVCPNDSCKEKIYDNVFKGMLSRGKYIAENPAANVASYWVSGLCSPWRTISSSAKSLYNAYKSGDQNSIKTIVNTTFGECYEISGEAVSQQNVQELIRPYKRGVILDGVEAITCGCDVQGDCIYYAIRGWGKKEQSWLIQYGILYGDTETEKPWVLLKALLKTPIQGKLIRLACIDSGYRPVHVYAFCRDFGPGAISCKGYPSQSAPIRKMSFDVAFTNNKFSTGGYRYCVDDGYFKSQMFARIKNKTWFVPENVEDEYIAQITAEERIIDKHGRLSWKQVRKNNHYLDAEKLNHVAATMIRIDLLDHTQAPKERIVSKGVEIWQ